MSSETNSVAQRLTDLDTCAVSDALDTLSLPPAVTGIRRLSTEKKISGPVITVLLESGTPETDRHLCTAAIDQAEPGDVIVVQQSTGIDAAGWGVFYPTEQNWLM